MVVVEEVRLDDGGCGSGKGGGEEEGCRSS